MSKLYLQDNCSASLELTLEDGVENQQDTPAQIGRFLGQECSAEHAVLDYHALYPAKKGFMPVAAEFKRSLIDRFGVHAALTL